MLGDQRRRPFELGRMADGAAGKGKVMGKVAEYVPRGGKIGAAKHPVHAERGRRVQRADHRRRCRTYQLQVADSAAPSDRADDFLHRGHRDAKILESDVRHAKVTHLIHQTAGIFDGLIVSGQHEDEIHRYSRAVQNRPTICNVGNLTYVLGSAILPSRSSRCAAGVAAA